MEFLEEAAGLGAVLGEERLDLALEDVGMPVPFALKKGGRKISKNVGKVREATQHFSFLVMPRAPPSLPPSPRSLPLPTLTLVQAMLPILLRVVRGNLIRPKIQVLLLDCRVFLLQPTWCWIKQREAGTRGVRMNHRTDWSLCLQVLLSLHMHLLVAFFIP